MKTSKLLLLLFISTILASCTQETFIEENLTIANRLDITGSQNCQTVDLIAGQNYDAGDFSISQDVNGEIVVRYETMDGWELRAIHLYTGSLEEMPQNGAGNPRIGHFPIQTVMPSGATSYEHTISSSLCGIIAAHAEVSKDGQNETAWADGLAFSGNSWATYMEYCGCNN